MTFVRLQTSMSRLHIRWENAPDSDLLDIESLDDALAYMARRSGGKPVLISRETDARDPKVKKLYDAALKSERFSLASQWFHCVKVGDEVLDEADLLHPLFAGRNPPALVMLTPDGEKRVSFLGTTRRKVKWAPISGILAASYEKNPTRAVKGLEKLLCRFDALDGKDNELSAQLARAEKKQSKGKIAAITRKKAAVEKERQAAFAEEKELRELELRGSGDD